MSRSLFGSAVAAAALACISSASAHVFLDRPEAPARSQYRAVLQVPHGCKGSPTISVRVTVPEGMVGAKPMAKPGWSIETIRRPYAKPYAGPHGTLTEGVREIVWSGGKLSADTFDEFTFSARLSDDLKPGETVHVPVEQTCETGAHRWVQIPAAGQSAHDLAEPAPALRIVEAQARAPAATSAKTSAATTIRAGDLVIERPWLRATPGGARVAGGYVRITNAGKAPDRLVGTSIPLAERGELHEMKTEAGVMKMREIEGGLVLAPGETVELKPGGNHLMFMGLKGGLSQGQSVKGTLVFEKAGTVEVVFEVGALGARSPDAGAAGKAGGGHHHH
ncbi:DUF1775 domain-containing protein [Enterovirga rhinocerotis]|uniref:YncI copper-binding domain-containing protein n=1 Tax=Enterovirga rhinocerotis TaxID=1339210 RepID=A0A4R7C5L5_9HYPH|nr:DUF1775 domain-containing protein [Enterovirga rhinocerotis]TDR93688.1 hypothetical protein EV668_0953 [Enterovirga rhinocerotis]